MKVKTLSHEFVKTIPRPMVEGVLYVSMEFATAGHKCGCGCGSEVYTKLSPKDWQLTYDGQSISLTPSIGNWNFPCQSHYWIRGGNVLWDKQWSTARIDALKRAEAMEGQIEARPKPKRKSFWKRLMNRSSDD